MKHKLTLIVAIAMFCLTACAGAGPQLGTETDNTDIMTPEPVNTYTDADRGLDFLFPMDWEQHDGDEGLFFAPVDRTVEEKVIVEYIEDFANDGEAEDFIDDLADQGFVAVEEGALEIYHLQSGVDSDTDSFHRFIRKGLLFVHLFGFLDSERDFPVTVQSRTPVLDVNVCNGPCNQTYTADSRPAGVIAGNEPLERVPPAEDEVLQIAPSAMPQAPQLELAGAGTDDEGSDDAASSGTLEAQPIEFSIP